MKNKIEDDRLNSLYESKSEIEKIKEIIDYFKLSMLSPLYGKRNPKAFTDNYIENGKIDNAKKDIGSIKRTYYRAVILLPNDQRCKFEYLPRGWDTRPYRLIIKDAERLIEEVEMFMEEVELNILQEGNK